MKAVFLAHAFRPEDRELVSRVEALLVSHDVRPTTGERLGGQELTPAIKTRIRAADGLIALLTRRDQITTGGWTTHQWVLDELAFARAEQKRAIALVEEGVQLGGAYAHHEYLAYSTADLPAALVALSETIGVWKREAGRLLKVQILPDTLARRLGDDAQCSYRFVREGQPLPWQESRPIRQTGGVFLYLSGAHDDLLVEIRIKVGREVWASPATSQWMPIELRRQRGHP